MLRRLLLLGIALCGIAHADAPARIELSATPAWKGWARPGRATEVDIRLSTDVATRATLDVVAGRQSVRAELDLQPGRVTRLQVPVSSAERVAVSVASSAGPPQRLDIGLAQSESPLLGVGVASNDPIELDGFHTAVLAADDLPRNGTAYASLDALILDAPTLGALDQRQLGALLAHAAACGRIVVVNTDARVRRLLDGAGGCGGQVMLSADSLADAKAMLKSSLAASLPPAMSLGGIGELARPGHAIWYRVAVGLAAYFAAAALAHFFFASWPVLLLTPALAALGALGLLHAKQPSSQLVVWSEGDSGAPSARYQAWQQFPGVVRERVRVPIPPQLATAAQPCDSNLEMRFDFDAIRGRATLAEFETRLFRQVALCYSGSFPMARALAIEARADGVRDVRNAGTKAWPHGVLLADGLVHDLPALGPDVHTTIDAKSGKPVQDAAARTAMTRKRPAGAAALWELELGGVADAPIESRGWLLVSVSAP